MDELNRQKANHLSIRLERCLDDIKLHLICERTDDSADKILEKIRKIRDSISDPSIHQFIVSSVIEDSANDFKAELRKELAVIGGIINVFDVPELSRLTVLIEKLKDAVEQPYPCASNEAGSGTDTESEDPEKTDEEVLREIMIAYKDATGTAEQKEAAVAHLIEPTRWRNFRTIKMAASRLGITQKTILASQN